MNNPTNLQYTKDHEWAEIKGNVARIGITDHAQSALGDIVFAELPPVGRVLKKGEAFGVVESIKAVSDLYSPVTGKITQVNAKLRENPGAINQAPYESWLIEVEISEPSSISGLLDAKAYENSIGS